MFAFLLRSGCVRRTSFLSRNTVYLFDDTKLFVYFYSQLRKTRAEMTGRVEVVAHEVIVERNPGTKTVAKGLELERNWKKMTESRNCYSSGRR
jgi:uncharacterized protein YhbP (UPF0306 family)